MDKWRYNYLIEKNTLWEKKKLLITSNIFFSHKVFKSCRFLMRQNEYLWNKGLNSFEVIGKSFQVKFVTDGQTDVWIDIQTDKQGQNNMPLIFRCREIKQEGHDGPVSLHWLILGNLFKT